MINLGEGFSEIEYGTSKQKPLPAQKIEKPAYDPIRERFLKMRSISRKYNSYDRFDYILRGTSPNLGKAFTEQGRFMADFEDNYSKEISLSIEFPTYQQLNYEQLRTYFTWRTKIRRQESRNFEKQQTTDSLGNLEKLQTTENLESLEKLQTIENPQNLEKLQTIEAPQSIEKLQRISFPYVLLYSYELLNNIGVSSPQEGLDKLLYLWQSFRTVHPQLNVLVPSWFKDYFIFYDLPRTFADFVHEHKLQAFYGVQSFETQPFDLYSALSPYSIIFSNIYTKENKEMIENCFLAVLEDIQQAFLAAGMEFENVFFHPVQKLLPWEPFKDTPFYPTRPQRDRRVLIGSRELYICKNQVWSHSQSVTTTKGRKFIGFVMKKMDSVLRELTDYRRKLSAKLDMLDPATQRDLLKKGIQIDELVTKSVTQYYRDLTQVVVSVDDTILERIRLEALKTQERLAIPDAIANDLKSEDFTKQSADESESSMFDDDIDLPINTETIGIIPSSNVTSDPWQLLWTELSPNEREALAIFSKGKDIATFAQQSHIMPELLIDGINQKALDHIGDQLLDEDAHLYEDYQEQVKELLQ
ncbi:MAG: TerB N-terminal domain-containing protein [Clostridium sp.]|nr:TerB N-terminal domain-containing protein [Clostridium sp.]